jgi:four helix bundle protein
MDGHTRLPVWQDARRLVVEIYALTRGLAVEERFVVVAQMRRAAWSVSNNIAEGNARRGRAQLHQFLNCAIGSLAEVDSMVRILGDLYTIDQRRRATIDDLRIRITRGLFGLLRSSGRPRTPSSRNPVIPSSHHPVARNRNGGPILSDRPPSPHRLPGARGLTPAVLLPDATAWTDPSAGGRRGAPASIPKRPGRAARFAGASAASRIASRSDPSHGTPRRYVGVDEARELASPVRVGVRTRIVRRLSP